MKIIKQVLYANKLLKDKNLTFETFGNVSSFENNKIYIKPSGVDFDDLKISNISIVDINNVNKYIQSKPSVDLNIHTAIYKNFKNVKAVAHTHSTYACLWSQLRKPIPCLGTTHADYWLNDIPITRQLTKKETSINYENSIGELIVRTLKDKKLNPKDCPGILVAGHGPFTWGTNPIEAVKHMNILEFCAKVAYLCINSNNSKNMKLEKHIASKHFYRKNGKNKYYGQ